MTSQYLEEEFIGPFGEFGIVKTRRMKGRKKISDIR